MKLKIFDNLNPAAAYRKHGPRYGFFVFSKAAVLLLNLALASVTLVASFSDWEIFALCEQVAMFMLKIAAIAVPFLIFESVYWWYRLRPSHCDATQSSLHSKARAN